MFIFAIQTYRPVIYRQYVSGYDLIFNPSSFSRL